MNVKFWKQKPEAAKKAPLLEIICPKIHNQAFPDMEKTVARAVEHAKRRMDKNGAPAAAILFSEGENFRFTITQGEGMEYATRVQRLLPSGYFIAVAFNLLEGRGYPDSCNGGCNNGYLVSRETILHSPKRNLTKFEKDIVSNIFLPAFKKSWEARARKLVSSIGKEVDRLSDITETYLRFVRLPTPKLEREDLGALVTSVMEFAGGELELAGVTWNIEIEPGLPEVAADESQIRQALLNLVRNAKEAMPGGGSIRLSVSRTADGQVRLVLADSGPGISPENLASIFEPFFSTKVKGTGLGLALVQQIVSEHGGRIEVDCPPGGGTAFAILLPVAKPATVEVAVAGA